MKALNISKGKGTSKREMSAKTWQSKMNTQQYIIDIANLTLASEDATDFQREYAMKEIVKAMKVVAKLEAINPFEA
jgi:hypothetical protein